MSEEEKQSVRVASPYVPSEWGNGPKKDPSDRRTTKVIFILGSIAGVSRQCSTCTRVIPVGGDCVVVRAETKRPMGRWRGHATTFCMKCIEVLRGPMGTKRTFIITPEEGWRPLPDDATKE